MKCVLERRNGACPNIFKFFTDMSKTSSYCDPKCKLCPGYIFSKCLSLSLK